MKAILSSRRPQNYSETMCDMRRLRNFKGRRRRRGQWGRVRERRAAPRRLPEKWRKLFQLYLILADIYITTGTGSGHGAPPGEKSINKINIYLFVYILHIKK